MAVLAASVLCGLSANAQVNFGVKGGVTYTTFNVPLPNRNSNAYEGRESYHIQGFAGGLFMNFTVPFFPVSIQPELLYVEKGAESAVEEKFDRESSTREITLLKYLEIPVLAKFTIPISLPVQPNVFIGSVYSYLVDSKDTIYYIDGTTFAEKPQFEKNDFGITVGGGIDFNVVTTKLTLDARYTYGLTDIYKNSLTTIQIGDPTIKNRAWMVMLGVGF